MLPHLMTPSRIPLDLGELVRPIRHRIGADMPRARVLKRAGDYDLLARLTCVLLCDRLSPALLAP